MKNDRISNHERAPICAGFVRAMRGVFDEVDVLYVSEGDVKLGEPSERGVQPVLEKGES